MAVNEKDTISILSMEAILNGMGIMVDRVELQNYLGQMKKEFNEEEIDFELFVRVVAFLL